MSPIGNSSAILRRFSQRKFSTWENGMKSQFYCNWSYPTAIHLGEGRLLELADHCHNQNMKRPLLVTDAGLVNLPLIGTAKDILVSAGIEVSIFSDVQGNPVIGNLKAGISQYLGGNHDGIVAIGGGSGIDVGKLIALMAKQTIPVWDLEDIGDYWKRANSDVIAPIIAIPTTAGTGAEVGRAAVLTNTMVAPAEKKILFHPKMMPAVVIGDPTLATGLPPALTAATGMDALTHSLETFCVNSFHPMADGIALESLRLIKEFLPKACKNGDDIEARTMMQTAALMAGVAFQKGLGITHSISHAIGALYGVHHGLANAVLLPYVLVFNRPAIEEKTARIAHVLEIEGGFDGLLSWLISLRCDLEIPHTLTDLNIDACKIEEIAAKAQADPCTKPNPRDATPDDMKRVFMAAIEGNLN